MSTKTEATDRELLELAALAAGIAGTWQDGPFFGIIGSAIGDMDVPWNPLRNDGQALRLAVKLAIDFKVRNDATWWDCQESEGVVYWSHEPHNGDPLAATRRAIVRAAAEIGKSKK